MIRNIMFPALILIMTACTTIFETDKSTIDIYVNKPVMLYFNNDSLNVYKETNLEYTRSGSPMEIKVKDDSSLYILKLNPYPTEFFIFSNVLGYGAFHIFDLIFSYDKVFRYYGSIYVDIDSNKADYYLYGYPSKTRNTRLSIKLPTANHFYYNTPTHNVSEFGFMLFGVGIEEYLSQDYYLSFLAEFKSDYILPFPIVVDYYSQYEDISNFQISAMAYKDLDWLHFGIGLAYSSFYSIKNKTFKYYPKYEITRNNYSTLAIPFAIKKPITNDLSLGLYYVPSILRIGDKTKFEYSHTLNLSLIANFNFPKNEY